VDALASRGRINLQRGRMEAAATDFEKAVSIAPAIASARLGRAHLRARMHDWPGARADYDSVLQANPRNSEALYGRGLVTTWTGDSRRGADDMRMALALDAGAADRLAGFGLVMPPRQATAMATQD
jgi:Tfp pilus assembly protein PilF